MKKITLGILLFLFSLQTFPQSPNWIWAKSAIGTSADRPYAIAADANGNIYVTGQFRSSTITFGSITLTNSSGADVFIVKYDNNGNVLWANKSVGSVYDNVGFGIAADNSGNCYVTGVFASNTIAFGSIILTNVDPDYYDIFLAKYDSNGNVLWAKRAGAASEDVSNSVAIDVNGDIYITGYFHAGTITFGTTTLTNSAPGFGSFYIAKYNSNGNPLWAQGIVGVCSGNSVTVNNSGDIYVAGSFLSNLIMFGSTILTNASAGSFDIFIAKYNSSGSVLWAKRAGNTLEDSGMSLAVDGNGNACLIGYFLSDTITFGATTLANTATGYSDMFLVKYDVNGNVLWAQSAGGSGNDYGIGIAIDSIGNSFVTGGFRSATVTFGNNTLTNAGSNSDDILVVKYDNSGNVLWAKSEGGPAIDDGTSIAADAIGNCYVTGYFYSDTLSFDATNLIRTGTSSNDDIFIAKLDYFVSAAEISTSYGGTDIFPNPATNELIVQSSTFNVERIEIYNVVGERVRDLTSPLNPLKGTSASIDVSELTPGIYFVTVMDDARNKVVRKVVKM